LGNSARTAPLSPKDLVMTLERTRLTLGLGVSALALVLTGCAGASDEQPRSAAAADDSAASSKPPLPNTAGSAKPARSASPSPTGSPAESPATSTSPAAATGPGAKRTLPDRLLAASEVPGFEDGFAWRVASTRRTEGREPFGTCHKYAMTSIGAMRVAVRQFTPKHGSDADTASHLVADFADGSTARRAFEVLKSWRAQCGEELSEYQQRDVGKLQSVDVPGGVAGWYLLTYGPASGENDGDAYFDAQGMTRVGKRISVLQMRLVAQDYDYPPGQEPVVEAVRTAAGKLG
jgi:hypothetical protein